MFGFSLEHLLVIFILLVLVGPKKLPELGNTLGKFIRNFKDSLNGVEEASFRNLEDSAAPPLQESTTEKKDENSDKEKPVA